MDSCYNECLFVRVLPGRITATKLRKSFVAFEGIDKIKIIRDFPSKLCKGYAFITITGGPKNLDAVQNSDIFHEGKLLEISLSNCADVKKILTEWQYEHKLIANDLPKKLDNDDLLFFFQQFGVVDSARVVYRDGVSQRFGCVVYEDKEVVEKILEMPSIILKNKKLKVSRCIQTYCKNSQEKPISSHKSEKNVESPVYETCEDAWSKDYYYHQPDQVYSDNRSTDARDLSSHDQNPGYVYDNVNLNPIPTGENLPSMWKTAQPYYYEGYQYDYDVNPEPGYNRAYANEYSGNRIIDNRDGRMNNENTEIYYEYYYPDRSGDANYSANRVEVDLSRDSISPEFLNVNEFSDLHYTKADDNLYQNADNYYQNGIYGENQSEKNLVVNQRGWY